MKYFSVLVLVCFTATCLADTTYKDCGSQATIHSVRVTNCVNGQAVCNLRRGTTISMDIEFTANKEFKRARTRVDGKLPMMPFPVPYPIQETNVCKTGVSCPIKAGEKQRYRASLEVKRNYPKLKVGVFWKIMVPGQTKPLVCVNVPTAIVD